MDSTWREMHEHGFEWHEMQALECEECKEERERRRLVMRPDDDRLTRMPFVAAPYIHFLNWPKYQALHLRAITFAANASKQLLWVTARDFQKTKDAKVLDKEAERRKREQWLQVHDQQTKGIMGLLPLVRDMPVRFTETVSRWTIMMRWETGTACRAAARQ